MKILSSLAVLALATGVILSTCACSPSTEPDKSSGSSSGTGGGTGEDTGGGTGGGEDTGGSSQSNWVLCEQGDKTWNRYMSESYDQVYIQDGVLNLVGELVDGEYKTGGIETRGRFTFTYGKVEVRARFDKMPQGNHTGIWMMPEPPAEQWPKSGEIDIMEHLNKDNIIYQTVHSYYLDDMDKTDPKGRTTVEVDKEDWNVYGIIWTEDELTYTVNGQNYLSYPNLKLSDTASAAYQWPFDKPFYIILSQSLGGEGTWEGPITNSELPSIFQIDWVKVYQNTSGQSDDWTLILYDEFDSETSLQ